MANVVVVIVSCNIHPTERFIAVFDSSPMHCDEGKILFEMCEFICWWQHRVEHIKGEALTWADCCTAETSRTHTPPHSSWYLIFQMCQPGFDFSGSDDDNDDDSKAHLELWIKFAPWTHDFDRWHVGMRARAPKPRVNFNCLLHENDAFVSMWLKAEGCEWFISLCFVKHWWCLNWVGCEKPKTFENELRMLSTAN